MRLQGILSFYIQYPAVNRDMSILKFSEFVEYKTAIGMFNCILPIQLQRRFTKYFSVHSTRQNKSFVVVQVRTNIKAMCLSILWCEFMEHPFW